MAGEADLTALAGSTPARPGRRDRAGYDARHDPAHPPPGTNRRTARSRAGRSCGLPRRRDTTPDRRRRVQRAIPRPPRRGRPGPRGRGDGHDAVRVRSPVRRPAGGLEPDPARGRPADPPRLSRRRVAHRHDQHVRRQPASPRIAQPRPAGRGAEPDRGGPASLRGGRDGRARARRGRHRPDRGDHGADRDARLRGGRRRLRRAGGGARRGRRGPDLDRDDVGSHRGQGRHRGRSAGRHPGSRSSRR